VVEKKERLIQKKRRGKKGIRMLILRPKAIGTKVLGIVRMPLRQAVRKGE